MSSSGNRRAPTSAVEGSGGQSKKGNTEKGGGKQHSPRILCRLQWETRKGKYYTLSLLPSQYFSCIKFGEPEVFPRKDYDLVPFCGVHSAAKAWLLSVCLRDLEWAGQAHFMPLH